MELRELLRGEKNAPREETRERKRAVRGEKSASSRAARTPAWLISKLKSHHEIGRAHV